MGAPRLRLFKIKGGETVLTLSRECKRKLTVIKDMKSLTIYEALTRQFVTNIHHVILQKVETSRSIINEGTS